MIILFVALVIALTFIRTMNHAKSARPYNGYCLTTYGKGKRYDRCNYPFHAVRGGDNLTKR